MLQRSNHDYGGCERGYDTYDYEACEAPSFDGVVPRDSQRLTVQIADASATLSVGADLVLDPIVTVAPASLHAGDRVTLTIAPANWRADKVAVYGDASWPKLSVDEHTRQVTPSTIFFYVPTYAPAWQRSEVRPCSDEERTVPCSAFFDVEFRDAWPITPSTCSGLSFCDFSVATRTDLPIVFD
jgi:hypothetical protein